MGLSFYYRPRLQAGGVVGRVGGGVVLLSAETMIGGRPSIMACHACSTDPNQTTLSAVSATVSPRSF